MTTAVELFVKVLEYTIKIRYLIKNMLPVLVEKHFFL